MFWFWSDFTWLLLIWFYYALTILGLLLFPFVITIQEVADNNCVYRNEIHHAEGERTQVLQDVAADPTLPRTKSVRCTQCGHGEAVFFQVPLWWSRWVASLARAGVNCCICLPEERCFSFLGNHLLNVQDFPKTSELTFSAMVLASYTLWMHARFSDAYSRFIHLWS